MASVGSTIGVTNVLGPGGGRGSTRLSGLFPSCGALGYCRLSLMAVEISINGVGAQQLNEANGRR